MSSRKDSLNREAMLAALERAGITTDDAELLRRISMTLHRWHERTCGTDRGCIERDEATGEPYYLRYPGTAVTPPMRWEISDRETGALERLAAIMGKYPTLSFYVQPDPRGASLYILRPGDVRGGDPSICYTNGIAVYR